MNPEKTPKSRATPESGFLPFESVQETVERNKIAAQYGLSPKAIYLKDGRWYHEEKVLRDKSFDNLERDDSGTYRGPSASNHLS